MTVVLFILKLNEIRNLATLIEIIHANIYEVECGYDNTKNITLGNNKIIVFEDIDACCEDLIKQRDESKNNVPESKKLVETKTLEILIHLMNQLKYFYI